MRNYTSRCEVLQMLAALSVTGIAQRSHALAGAGHVPRHAADIQLGAQTNAWSIDPKNLDLFVGVLDQIKPTGYAGFETRFFNLINYFDSPKAASDRIAALGGIYQLHDGRENPDTVSAVIQYRDWNLNFESSVPSIRNDRPSVYSEGTEGTLDLAREGYIFTPNNGEPVTVAATESLEQAHTKNFLDAITTGARVNAPPQTGINASRPVQLALHSYWKQTLATPSDL